LIKAKNTTSSTHTNPYTHVHKHMHTYIYVYIYKYIYLSRERGERKEWKGSNAKFICTTPLTPNKNKIAQQKRKKKKTD